MRPGPEDGSRDDLAPREVFDFKPLSGFLSGGYHWGRNVPPPWIGHKPLDWGPGHTPRRMLLSETSSDSRVVNALGLHAKLRLRA